MGKTEKELADSIARRIKITVRKSREYLQVLLETLREDLHRTGKSKLRGLGTLEVHSRQPRKTKHPTTGEVVEIPACKAVQFRASKTLKDLINPPKPKKKPKGNAASSTDDPSSSDSNVKGTSHTSSKSKLGKHKKKRHSAKTRASRSKTSGTGE